MFNPKNLLNSYHELQKLEQENLQRNQGNAPPPTSSRRETGPSFNPLQLLAYLSQLDITNPPPEFKKALTNPIFLVGIAIFLWLLIGLLTKLIFVAVVGGVAYFLIKGSGGNGASGPQEDVVGKKPPFPHQSSSNSQSPYPSPGVGNSNQQQPQQPKDLAGFLWQKGKAFLPFHSALDQWLLTLVRPSTGVPAGIELAQTFLNKRTRQEATREVRTTNDQDE
ncbi:uncharacterized protein JCM6883_004907 [Sporobolomyces salmoneus]|uniref:uncharacterized protein n=1 Tax=Sporobolomyces salmoneus TaxID=183962 RepID=UPI00317593B1